MILKFMVVIFSQFINIFRFFLHELYTIPNLLQACINRLVTSFSCKNLVRKDFCCVRSKLWKGWIELDLRVFIQKSIKAVIMKVRDHEIKHTFFILYILLLYIIYIIYYIIIYIIIIYYTVYIWRDWKVVSMVQMNLFEKILIT